MRALMCGVAVAIASLVLVACGKSNGAPSSSASASPTPAAAPATPAPLAVVAPAKTYDGPLGLAMGIPIEEIQGALKFGNPSESQPNFYPGTPPKPAPGFESYFVLATKGQGLCRVVAIAPVNVVNDSGDQIKAEADRIAEMLELKYGKPKKYDFATQDVYRRNPQFFMMALREDAVTYGYEWESKPGAIALPNDLSSIEVLAQASDMRKGWVRLMYTFTNEKACAAEIKKQKSANL